MNIVKLRHMIREEIESTIDSIGDEPIENEKNDFGFDITDFSDFRGWIANLLSEIGCPQDIVDRCADVDDSQSPVALALYDAWADLNNEEESGDLDSDVMGDVMESLVRDLKNAHRSPRFMVERTIERIRNRLNS